MFIKVDKPIPGIKLKSVKQIIEKAGKYLHLLVDSDKDKREELVNDWKNWFQANEGEDRDTMTLFAKFEEILNPVSRYPVGCESISSLCLKGEVELLNHMLEYKPIKMEDLQSVETTMGGLVGSSTAVSIYDRYLLKHGANRLLNLGATEVDMGPLNNLIVLLKAMDKKPPRELKIFSEFFQLREFRDARREENTEESSRSEWMGIVQGDGYEKFVRGLMESLVDEIRSLYSGLKGTVISLHDCTRGQYKSGSLPHDRYLELNRIIMVSTGGFNFTVPGWKTEEYRSFTSTSDKVVQKINPTMLIPIAHMGIPPQGTGVVKFEAGMT